MKTFGTFGIFTWVVLALISPSTGRSQTPPSPTKYALLVGCTHYPNCPKLRALTGPKNDVSLLAGVLQSQFDFENGNIHRLVGWDSEPATRPTYDNIVAAFERLIEQASAGSQVVILMSGHGTQIPAVHDHDALAEDDGLDEVFLPADVKPWADNALPGAIVDNKFAEWLTALRNKGSHVWIIFDSCHSGTMTRDIDSGEVVRSVPPEDLRIPPVAFVPGTPRSSEPPLELAGGSGTGSVAEFYAAQSFEEAIELPRPLNGPRTPDRVFGLFCYNLVQALERQGTSLSYADLGNSIIGSYRTERGSRGPTPLFAGDLQRQVMGINVWPPASDILFERRGSQCVANAGSIRGISPGTILSLLAGKAADGGQRLIGYVRAEEVTAVSATVVPCEFSGIAASAIEMLPEQAYCQIVYRDLGDMRVKLTVADSEAAPEMLRITRDALQGLPSEIRALVDTEAPADKAEWFLVAQSVDEAEKFYGQTLSQPGVLLVQQLANRDAPATDRPKVWMTYDPLASAEPKRVTEFAERLAGDLQKVFTWQNIWRVAHEASSAMADSDLSLEISELDDSGNPKEVNPTQLTAGDRLQITIANRGTEDWWLTLLYLGPNLEVQTQPISKSIGAGGEFLPLKGRLKDGLGSGGFVLLAAPMRHVKIEPSYSPLVQTALGRPERSRAISDAAPNPLARLMVGAAIGKGVRGFEVGSPERPQVLVRSWVTVQKPAAVE